MGLETFLTTGRMQHPIDSIDQRFHTLDVDLLPEDVIPRVFYLLASNLPLLLPRPFYNVGPAARSFSNTAGCYATSCLSV